ncbi:hypothetical protein [Haloplanus salilacus]|uniref:hypothetical protein n=1 Tax=Haloplanus salilacus TaxID=2949994 RepID=UPI0030D459C4
MSDAASLPGTTRHAAAVMRGARAHVSEAPARTAVAGASRPACRPAGPSAATGVGRSRRDDVDGRRRRERGDERP